MGFWMIDKVQDGEDFLTVSEVAAKLRISRSLVYREIQQGRLHSHQFGARCYRVAASELRRYQAANLLASSPIPSESIAKQRAVTSPSLLRHVRLKRSPSERT